MPLPSGPITLAYLGGACAFVLALGGAMRARRSLPRWAFAAGMLLLATDALLAAYAARATELGASQHWQQWRMMVCSFAPAVWLLFSLTYSRGDSSLRSRKVSGLLFASSLLPVICLFARQDAFVAFGPNGSFPAAASLFRLRPAGMVLYGGFLLGAIGTVMNLERTFRASVGTIRWRIKFMLLGVGVIFVTRIYTGSQILVFRAIDPALGNIDIGALILATPLILRSFFRAGHFDFDVYPSESILRRSLTLLLAGLYLVIVGALAKAVAYFGGDAAFAAKAFFVMVALVALALVLQSDRAHQRLAHFVSRHFHRPVYDYRTVWKKVADATMSHVDQTELARAIAAMVADLFQTLSVNVWLANEKKDVVRVIASTSIRDNDAACTAEASAAAEILAHFKAQPGPVDIETDPNGWAGTLRTAHPTQFPHGGRRIGVDLTVRGEVVGVITIGDRVGGEPFSLQDLEMLKCVADHAAGSIMNLQLARRLVEARELEAFQAMAAFFVHDLKNAATTLNLMLQNLPAHFDKPEFRADALRGVTKTVDQLNRLINRLTQLRHEVKIELASADVNEVLNRALAGMGQAAGTTLVKETQPLPRIQLDGDQFSKVIANLVLNATEAVTRGGRIRIATAQQNGWVVLTVDDNGCGMTNDFVSRSLFRPFQTTKERGLGIGMFQSKMIVEAHGGRIAVASTPGKGTTFNVFLPTSARVGT